MRTWGLCLCVMLFGCDQPKESSTRDIAQVGLGNSRDALSQIDELKQENARLRSFSNELFDYTKAVQAEADAIRRDHDSLVKTVNGNVDIENRQIAELNARVKELEARLGYQR